MVVFTDIHLTAPKFVESVVKQLLDNWEKKQWRVSLLVNEVKICKQAERLAKFLLGFGPIVKNALIADPYTALAWSSVSLLLPPNEAIERLQFDYAYSSLLARLQENVSAVLTARGLCRP